MSEAGGESDPSGQVPEARTARVRLLAIVLAVLVVTGAAVGWLWISRESSNRGDLEQGEQWGIDVSTHQKAIDWNRVEDDGIDFAYIKATEGGDFVDDRFATNWDGAGSAGVKRGACHFFTLCRPGADQAENFLRTAPPAADALPPVVDLEFVGNCSRRPSREELIRELNAFVDRAEQAWGQPLVFYLMDDFDQEYGIRGRFNRQMWLRSLGQRPPSAEWRIWQTSDTATVAGIEGGVDLDVMKAS